MTSDAPQTSRHRVHYREKDHWYDVVLIHSDTNWACDACGSSFHATELVLRDPYDHTTYCGTSCATVGIDLARINH